MNTLLTRERSSISLPEAELPLGIRQMRSVRLCNVNRGQGRIRAGRREDQGEHGARHASCQFALLLRYDPSSATCNEAVTLQFVYEECGKVRSRRIHYRSRVHNQSVPQPSDRLDCMSTGAAALPA